MNQAASRLGLAFMRSVSVLQLFAPIHPILRLATLIALCCCPAAVDASPAADAIPPSDSLPSDSRPLDHLQTDSLQAADDVWVVSTRRLPDIRCLPTRVSLGVEQLVPDAACSRWMPSDLQGLLDAPQRPLMLFIHGNRYDPASAKSQGLALARRIAAARPNDPPVRTVIFSWPSSQEGLLLRDSRAKYERSMTEGYYFAWLLGQLEPSRPVAIVAYSYGSLIALEALDNLVNAEKSGRTDLQSWIDRPARLHLVLVASAVRHDALAPRGAYRDVVRCIDRLTLLNNTRDQALRFFEFIDPDLRTEALGHENMPARWLPPEVEFTQVDAAPIVGKSHRFPPYMESPSLRQRLATGAIDGLADD